MAKARKWEFPGDPGGLTKDAPIGSVAWAQRVRVELSVALEDLVETPKRVMRYLQLLVDHEAWVLLNKRDGSTFESLEEFVATEAPWGLGMPISEITLYLEASFGKSTKLMLASMTKCSEGALSDRQRKRLRAVMRAPSEVADLYKRNLIGVKYAARLGPLNPSEEEARKIAQTVAAIKRMTNKQEIHRTIRETMEIDQV